MIEITLNNTYQLCADNMPVLSVTFEMGVLHQVVVFKDCFPIFVVFAVVWIFTHELLYCDLMTVEILENEIVEISGFEIFSKLNVNIRLTWSLRFSCIFPRNQAVSLNN